MSYLRENVERMEGYTPGFQPAGEGWVKLNTNENPFPPSPKVIAALREAVDGKIRLYPDPLADRVREKIAEVCRVEKDCVIVGNGGDEVLAMAARAFLGEGQTLLMTRPSYTLYRVLGEIQGARVIEIPLEGDFSLPKRIFSEKAALTFISNPNPPSGFLYEKGEMERLCKETGGVVMIDEAYVDFAKSDCLDLAGKYDNVLIARSMSKFMAMAGLRVGFGIGDRGLVRGMMKVKDSYNVNRLSQVAAVAALDDLDYYAAKAKEVCRERENLTKRLRELGWQVFPSQANFIFAVPVGLTAKDMYEELFNRKILVRYFDTPETKDGLRITIGSPDENRRLLEAIRAVQGEKE
jgi:histidinol-phosphate aminotransferase